MADFSSEKHCRSTGHRNSRHQQRNPQWGCRWWDLNRQWLSYKPTSPAIALRALFEINMWWLLSFDWMNESKKRKAFPLQQIWVYRSLTKLVAKNRNPHWPEALYNLYINLFYESSTTDIKMDLPLLKLCRTSFLSIIIPLQILWETSCIATSRLAHNGRYPKIVTTFQITSNFFIQRLQLETKVLLYLDRNPSILVRIQYWKLSNSTIMDRYMTFHINVYQT